MKINVRRVLLCFSSVLLLCMTALCLSFSVSAADGEPTAAEMIPVTVDMQGKGENVVVEVPYATPWEQAVGLALGANQPPVWGDYAFCCFSPEPMADNPLPDEVYRATEALQNLLITEETTIYIVWVPDVVNVVFQMGYGDSPSFSVKLRRAEFGNEAWYERAFPDGYPTREGYELLGFTDKPLTAYANQAALLRDVCCKPIAPEACTPDGRLVECCTYYAVWFTSVSPEISLSAPVCGDPFEPDAIRQALDRALALSGCRIEDFEWDAPDNGTVVGGRSCALRFRILPLSGFYLKDLSVVGAQSVETVRNEDLSVGVVATVRTVHCFDAPVWTWSEDHSGAQATFTCAGCGETHTAAAAQIQMTELSPATETEDRVVKYTATVTFDDADYTVESDPVAISGSALGASDQPDQPAEASGDESAVAVFLKRLKELFRAIRSFFLRMFGSR